MLRVQLFTHCSPEYPLAALCRLTVLVAAIAVVASPASSAQVCAGGGPNVGCTHPGAVCSPVTSGTGKSGKCTTSLPKGEYECNCTGTPIPLIDPRCSDRTAQGKFDCKIDQPPVNKPETQIPAVLFAPGDIVQVKADGCVQTGGIGDTWKRYVNPAGDDSDRLYHGLIRIPTGTKDSQLVRINTIIGTQLQVTGAGVPVSQLALSLGYEDDNYSDNGYDSHDDGTVDQCRDDPSNGNYGGPAYVTVTIFRGVDPDPPSSRFNFDVLSNAVDPNGLPYNPQWSWQQRNENQGKIPDTSLCHNFSMRGTTLGIPDLFLSPNFPDCTDQAGAGTVDLPSFPNEQLCNAGTGAGIVSNSFAGHVNWFPVTVEGRAGTVNHYRLPFPFGDDDYDFTFHMAGEDGNDIDSLSVNGRPGLHVEFDSDETIDNFTSKEWTDLKTAVDLGDVARTTTLFKGHTILTGMFGLDGEHDLKSELHPLYAMATLRDDYENRPDDQVWLIFVRNQGDEGYCSSRLWDAGFEDYTFRLPWRQGSTGANVDWTKTNFMFTPGASGPSVVMVPPSPTNVGQAPAKAPGVYVTFHLGPPVHNTSVFGAPASIPFINGALHLIWALPRVVGGGQTTTTGGLPLAPANAQQAVAADEEDEPEGRLRAAINQLTPSQQLQVQKASAIAATPPAGVHPLASPGPVKIATTAPVTAKVLERSAINAGPATQKMQRDAAQMRALCGATNNAPAGLPASVCGSK